MNGLCGDCFGGTLPEERAGIVCTCSPAELVIKKGLRFESKTWQQRNPDGSWSPAIYVVTAVRKIRKGSSVTLVYYGTPDPITGKAKGHWYTTPEKFPSVVGRVLDA